MGTHFPPLSFCSISHSHAPFSGFQRPVGNLEIEASFISFENFVAQRLRKSPAEYVHPAENVALADVVLPKEPNRVVERLGFRRVGGSFFFDAQELVIEHSFGAHGVMSILSYESFLELPTSGETVDQGVLPLGGSLRGGRDGKQKRACQDSK